jgi:hypothetical protein
MNCARADLRTLLLIAVALAIGACTTAPRRAEPPAAPAAGAVLGSLQLDRATEERILALDPEHIGGEQVRTVLAAAPAPRVLLLHGGIYPVHLAMSSFAEFLIGMGYPENRIRRDDGELDSVYSYSPYQDAEQIAGMIAWYYEREGLRPMIVGHSQGGIQAVKILYELAGEYRPEIRVWNPHTDTAEGRTTIIDPFTGAMRPVVGLSVSYASAVGAGGVAFVLPNQWSMVHRLHTIPDTVDDFTGFTIGVDLVALNFPSARRASEFRHNGSAKVRNVVLPSAYNHVVVPVTRELATSEAMREWINAYVPERKEQLGTIPPGPSDNLLWAADVWYSIKQHWCLEAQRLIRAKRAALAAQ